MTPTSGCRWSATAALRFNVLLDTSVLITFAKPHRQRPGTARQSVRGWVQRQLPIDVSTIGSSAFQLKQAINGTPLRNFVVLPFKVDIAMRCGISVRRLAREVADDRMRVKDDFKLIAQCDCDGTSPVLSEDASTLVQCSARAQAPGVPVTRPILLKDGFDPARYDNGQKPLANNWWLAAWSGPKPRHHGSLVPPCSIGHDVVTSPVLNGVTGMVSPAASRLRTSNENETRSKPTGAAEKVKANCAVEGRDRGGVADVADVAGGLAD